MLKKFRSQFHEAKDWYSTYKREINLASHITIKNKQLYQELETESKKQGGVLTYAEYVTIEQFGKHGFYGASDLHGTTDVETRWGFGLANYCLKFGHDTIIEFGCGTGELGVTTAGIYKQLANKPLKWIGVEIDKNIHNKILTNFKTYNLHSSVEKIVSSLEEIPNKKNALVVFPYSLDNIPPQVFLNTKNTASFPDALLGITIENGRLSETIIPQDVLQKKGMKFENGIFTQNNFSFNFSNWKLRRGQRAYVATDAFAALFSYAEKFPDATMIIIDEFSRDPWLFSLGHMGIPKSLYEKNLAQHERSRYYRESGMHNAYYPFYKDSLLKFLSMIGFRSVDYDIEQKKASDLRGKAWFPIAKSYSTYAFIAKDFTDKKLKVLPIPSPPKRIM